MELLKYKHAMLDLESVSTDPNGAILTIGILLFDPMKDEKDDFGVNYVVPFAHNKGRTVDLETMKWWMEQSPEAQRASWITGRDAMPATPEHSLYINALMQVFDQVDHIWANDPDFDCVMLKSFFEQHGVKWNWYRKHRSLRTIKAMFDVPFIEPVGEAHNSLDDCKYQARIVRAVYNGEAFPRYGRHDPYATFADAVGMPYEGTERAVGMSPALAAGYGSGANPGVPVPPVVDGNTWPGSDDGRDSLGQDKA
jgi:hypothetical protein